MQDCSRFIEGLHVGPSDIYTGKIPPTTPLPFSPSKENSPKLLDRSVGLGRKKMCSENRHSHFTAEVGNIPKVQSNLCWLSAYKRVSFLLLPMFSLPLITLAAVVAKLTHNSSTPAKTFRRLAMRLNVVDHQYLFITAQFSSPRAKPMRIQKEERNTIIKRTTVYGCWHRSMRPSIVYPATKAHLKIIYIIQWRIYFFPYGQISSNSSSPLKAGQFSRSALQNQIRCPKTWFGCVMFHTTVW